MRQLSTLPAVWMVLLVIASLTLVGCPKPPSIGQPGESAVTPGSGPAGSAATGPSGPSTGTEPSVSRPSVPAETPLGSAGGPGAGMGLGPGGSGGAGASSQGAGTSPLKDIYFDYDRFAILEDQKATLNQDAAWLKANPAVKVTIEGHCDERGATEYNLGLGERRARAVKEYLTAAGIAADRMTTISYGKERPLVLGHDENAWKWNRRVHFTLVAR